jgi:HEAT repeat protein
LLDGDAAGDPPVYNAVSEAIRSLGRDRLEGWQETLRRLAREGRYLEPVVGAMGDSRDPSFVPDLARIVLESSGNLPSDRVITQLASFLTDESAEALLAIAAHVQYSSPRQQCLDAVESIRAFQDARERWAGRRLARATRQQATVDLLELLDSDIEEQRVQAVRGLGTLGAVETLPRLIRLLEDPSEGIREAARGALDRLNRLNEEEGQ